MNNHDWLVSCCNVTRSDKTCHYYAFILPLCVMKAHQGLVWKRRGSWTNAYLGLIQVRAVKTQVCQIHTEKKSVSIPVDKITKFTKITCP
jgi:hypothetical protein